LAADADERRISELRFDELVWHMIAWLTIGFPPEGELLQRCQRRMREFVNVDLEADTAWPQWSLSPRKDTALVVRSLLESGAPPSNFALGAAVDRVGGSLENGMAEIAADDLANVISVLQRAARIFDDDGALPPAMRVCEAWSGDICGAGDNWSVGDHRAALIGKITNQLLDRQNPDGGWGERDCRHTNRHESDAAVTAAVMEALSGYPSVLVRSAIRRATYHLRMAQRADGSWSRDPEAADIRATSAAIGGLLSAGTSPGDEAVAAGVNWLVVHQEPDGGWSAADLEVGNAGASSPSPTAWAVMALVAAGRANHRATRRGIEFLVDSQEDGGSWTDGESPHCEMVAIRLSRNHLHAAAWSLLALSRWAVAANSARSAAEGEMSLRLVGVSAAD
jgi:hypothetical protein